MLKRDRKVNFRMVVCGTLRVGAKPDEDGSINMIWNRLQKALKGLLQPGERLVVEEVEVTN